MSIGYVDFYRLTEKNFGIRMILFHYFLLQKLTKEYIIEL